MSDEIKILIIDDKSKEIGKLKQAMNNKSKKIKLSFKFYPEGNEEGFAREISDLSGPRNIENLYQKIKKIVEDNKINLIILDFYLTNETNYGIDRSDGYFLLKHIRENGGKFSKIPIYSYTFKQEALDNGKEFNVSGMLQGHIPKSENIEDDLSNRILYNMEFETKKYSEIQEADIVVVCALKKEIKPVIDLLDKKDFRNDISDTFAIGDIPGKNNKKLKIIAVTKEQMGMAEAATLTTQMIEKYSPKFVVMTGIAAGMDEKFLDILMPSNIYNWQSGKFKEINANKKIIHVFEQKISPAITHILSNTDLSINTKYLKKFPEDFLFSEGFEGEFNEKNIKNYIQVIKKIADKNRSEFQKEILCLCTNEKVKTEKEIELLKKEDFSKAQKLKDKLSKLTEENVIIEFINNMVNTIECNIQKEGMVSGSAVIADEELKKSEIQKRGIHGIDMEAYGVAYACNNHSSKPEVIILKAICDFADKNKNDIYQSAAAYVSAQVFYRLFTEYIDIG